MKRIIEISEDNYKVIEKLKFLVGGRTDRKLQQTVINAIKNSTPIEECEDCTNGDMIKAMFPHYDIEVYEHKGYMRVFYDDFYTTYPWQWWNAPYKGNIYPKSNNQVLEDIKAEILVYKDDKLIHEEQNEMIDIMLGIIDSHISRKEQT